MTVAKVMSAGRRSCSWSWLGELDLNFWPRSRETSRNSPPPSSLGLPKVFLTFLSMKAYSNCFWHLSPRCKDNLQGPFSSIFWWAHFLCSGSPQTEYLSELYSSYRALCRGNSPPISSSSLSCSLSFASSPLQPIFLEPLSTSTQVTLIHSLLSPNQM